MESVGLSLGRADEIEEASKSSSLVHTETSRHQTLSARGHRSPTQSGGGGYLQRPGSHGRGLLGDQGTGGDVCSEDGLQDCHLLGAVKHNE